MPEYKDLGLANNEIVSVQKTSGTGLPGSIDTYTITVRDGSTFTFNVTNGNNGTTNINRQKFTNIVTCQTFLAANKDNVACVIYCHENNDELEYETINFHLGYDSGEQSDSIILRYLNTTGTWVTLSSAFTTGEFLYVYYFENSEGGSVVPTSRTIAGLSLESDITENALFDKMSIKGRYATLTALQTANPNHGYCYLVESNNHWYYWNGAAWTDGGGSLDNIYAHTINTLVGTDLNAALKTGSYGLIASTQYTNCPSEAQGLRKFLKVYNVSVGDASVTVQQLICHNATNGAYYKIFVRSIRAGFWDNWYKVYDMNGMVTFFSKYNYDNSLIDLNDALKMGSYGLTAGTTYTNCPSEAQGLRKYLEVYNASLSVGEMIVQKLICHNATSGAYYKIFVRTLRAGTWDPWYKVYDMNEAPNFYSARNINNVLTDLNDAKSPGTYSLAGATEYLNMPNEASGLRKNLRVYIGNLNPNQDMTDGVAVFQELYCIGTFSNAQNSFFKVFIRMWRGGTVGWSSWKKVYDIDDNNVLENNISESFSLNNGYKNAINVGTKIKVASYNVAHYNNDTATYLNNTQVFNFRKTLMEINADIICIQEDRKHIDSENTKSALNYLFAPIYEQNVEKNVSGNTGPSIKSKMQSTINNILKFDDGRQGIAFGTYNINNKTVLIISVHAMANYNGSGTSSSETIACRLQEYTDLFAWINGTKQFEEATTTTLVSCPTHDYVIICGDMNSITSTDKNNLSNLVSANNYTMANGGYLGWLISDLRDNWSLDNIIVSSNIIINKTKVYSSKYNELYSDHVPIEAELTLLEN